MEPLKNVTGLTSFDWNLVGNRKLARIKKVKIGMFKRLIRWLM